jgi:ribose transport system substrate-binding protein
MRKIGLLLLLVGGLALTACGGAQVKTSGNASSGGVKPTGPIRLAVVPKAVGFDYWEKVRSGAQCATNKNKDVNMEWNGVTQETDVSGQISLLQNFITQNVNGLVYAATDGKALAQINQQAVNQKVTTVNMDAGTTPQPPEVPLIATDNYKAASQVPDKMAEAMGPQGGPIAFIPFQPGSLNSDQRQAGFLDGLKHHPELKLEASASSNSSYDTAISVSQDMLTAHPDLKAIFASNEPSALGAAEAVRHAGKQGKVMIFGWDFAPDEIKDLQQGLLNGVVAQNPFKEGYDGVQAAVTKIRGKGQPQSEDTGSLWITQQNLNDPQIKTLIASDCKNPPLF